MNAGRPLGLLSACFVLPLEDSIPEIMETARQVALVQRAGGGTGMDLSRLRPKGSIVRSSGGTTDGPISFLKMLSSVTEAIQQGAFRRGANMGIMRIDHPDIWAFVDLKSDLGQVTNYNLSVAVTDEFMRQVTTDPHAIHVVVNPHTDQRGVLRRAGGSAEYGVASPTTEQFLTVDDVWRQIVQRAWQSGDPGLVFIDQVNRHNPTPQFGPIRATNPCGEQPLLPYEACNLGSINLAVFCKTKEDGSVDDHLDWNRLGETVDLAVRFLDDVVEANRYPTPQIQEATCATRKIGLGVMGWADLLFQLGVPYDSDEAIHLADRLGAYIRERGWQASQDLADQRGVFPSWEGSLWQTDRDGLQVRNAQVTTIAPTGTISIIAGCSSGIEPLFSLAFTRQVLGGKQLVEVNPIFQAALRTLSTDEEQLQAVIQHAAQHGTIHDRGELPESIRSVFRTARDVTPEWHVRMQAAWQRHTDAAVSKTINLPVGAAVEDVDAAYRLAFQLQCKGITVYRDGSRSDQPMALGSSEDSKAAMPTESHRAVPIKLPEVIPSVRLRQQTPFGNMHLHISVDPQTQREREVFAQLGKGGDLANSDLEAICRLVSLLLRCGGDIALVIDQLEGIGSSISLPSKGGAIKSLADGLARALRKYVMAKESHGLNGLLTGEVTTLDTETPSDMSPGSSQQEQLFKIKCPECDGAGTLAFQEGCLKCHACGYSIC